MAIFDVPLSVDDLPKNFSISEGWYHATVVDAEVKDTKNGLGKFLKVDYEIIGPVHAHSHVFGNINFKNPSEDATRIGLTQLGKLCRALHIQVIDDESALINGETIEIKIAIEKSEEYGDKNVVRDWRAVNPNRPATGIGSGASFLS